MEEGMPKKKWKEKGEALWLMSFSDMSLVMLCFFVLMLAKSTANQPSFDEVKDGVVYKKKNLQPLAKILKKEFKQEKLLKYGEVFYDQLGLHIEFKDGILFTPGSASSNRRYQKPVEKIMRILSKIDSSYELIVEGHTDDTPIMPGGKFLSNWELSAARGFKIMRKFKGLGVSGERISVNAYAHTRPKVEYKNKKGQSLQKARAANRRVVIWIE